MFCPSIFTDVVHIEHEQHTVAKPGLLLKREDHRGAQRDIALRGNHTSTYKIVSWRGRKEAEELLDGQPLNLNLKTQKRAPLGREHVSIVDGDKTTRVSKVVDNSGHDDKGTRYPSSPANEFSH